MLFAATASDGTENDVQIRHILEHLDRRGTLPRHDTQVIIGMNERRAGSLHHLPRSGFARRQGRLAQFDDSTVTPYRGLFGGRRVVGHDDVCRNTTQPGRARERRRVVARGVGRHAVRGFLRAHEIDGVGGAARLESPRFLQILALEIQAQPRLLIEHRARQQRRAMNLVADAIVRGADRLDAQAGNVGLIADHWRYDT
jgi:hypothetical protein